MLVMLKWIGGKIAGLFSLVLPMASKAASGARSPIVFWIAHFVIVVGILVGLTWLNRYLDLPRYLRAPFRWLAETWLPILFLLLYLNLWLGYWLWVLFRPSSRSSEHPDLDTAWANILTALDRAGLDLMRVPLFLVLGRPRNGVEGLFRTAGFPLNPMGPIDRTPLIAYGGPHGVFIVAVDCCLTSGLATWIARVPTVAAEDFIGKPTSTISASAGELLPSLAESPESESESVSPGPAVTPLTKNLAEMDRLSARFHHLNGLLIRTRRPYCAINGILALVPEASTRTETVANAASLLVGRDLAQIRRELQIHCPVLGIVCDGEQLPGFAELLNRIPADKRGQRFGRRLPYAPRLTPRERATMVETSVRWVCREVVPRLTYRVMAATTNPATPSEELVQLSESLFQRRLHLARLFADAFGSEDVGTVWAGGCYLAGTGRTTEQQGFLADIFGQLLDSQSLIAWTDEGRATEAAIRRRTRFGYLGLCLLAALVLGLAFTVFR